MSQGDILFSGLTGEELDERIKSDPRYNELFKRFRQEGLDRLKGDDAPQLSGLERRWSFWAKSL